MGCGGSGTGLSSSPGCFQAGIRGMEKSLTRRRPRSRRTAWSWSRPAAPQSAGSPGSSPRGAARLAKERMGWDPASAKDMPQRTSPGFQIPPGTRAAGFSFGSISTRRRQSGSHRLKANTRNELRGRNLHPQGRKNMEGAANCQKSATLSLL